MGNPHFRTCSAEDLEKLSCWWVKMTTHRLSVGSSGSPTPRGHMDHSLSWTDDLPVCHLSGVGFSTNQTYREDGFRCEDHEFEDRSIHFSLEGNISLYGVFDGHDGSRVPVFAAQRMPAELLLGQLDGRTNEEDIKDILLQAFISVEKGFTDSIDDLLAQKANLMLHVPEGIQQYELYNKYPELFKRLEKVEAEIAGGTTAVIALVKEAKLYIANVGCSRALLCTTDSEGVLRVVQLSADHDIHNQKELERLASIGTDIEALLKIGSIGNNNTYTRTIGDHDIKTAIRELEPFRNVTLEPVIAEPFVDGGISLEEQQGFLILMSYGLYKSVQDATGTEHVNRDIASMVASEFSVQSTLNGVAQAVVDRVVRLHHDTFMTSSGATKQRCQKRKDITLLVRNFNYPLPNAISSPTCGNMANPLVTALHSQLQEQQQHQQQSANPVVMPQQPVPANLNEPLSVIIPPNSQAPPQAPTSLFLYISNNTNNATTTSNTNSHTATNNKQTIFTSQNTTYSSNDSTQSGEDSLPLFQSKHLRTSELDVDADGRVGCYVEFSDFYKAIEEMTEAQRETFNSNSEPKPAYETIPEEPTTPLIESLDLEPLAMGSQA